RDARSSRTPRGSGEGTLMPEKAERELGFGAVMARKGARRLLNRDGSFNVTRRGLGFLRSLSPYHALLTISWPRFIALLAGFYLATNALFAAASLACGPGALRTSDGTSGSSVADAFFFSVATLATIGYGHIFPVGLPANILVTIESLVGLLSL